MDLFGWYRAWFIGDALHSAWITYERKTESIKLREVLAFDLSRNTSKHFPETLRLCARWITTVTQSVTDFV